MTLVIENTEDLTLFQTFIHFSSSKRDKLTPRENEEISKFVNNFGNSRNASRIIPSEIVAYVESFGLNFSESDKFHLMSLRKFLKFMHEYKINRNGLTKHLRINRVQASRTIHLATKNDLKIVERLITRSDYEEKKKNLSRLEKHLEDIINDVAAAAKDGDVRENAPLQAAREDHSKIKAEITAIQNDIKDARVIEDAEVKASAEAGKIHIGNKVVLERIDSKQRIKFILVEPREADPLISKISTASPVGSQLIDKFKGEKFTVKSKYGFVEYLIVEVS